MRSFLVSVFAVMVLGCATPESTLNQPKSPVVAQSAAPRREPSSRLDAMNKWHVTAMADDYAGYPKSCAPADSFPVCGTPEGDWQKGYGSVDEGVIVRSNARFVEFVYCEGGLEKTRLCANAGDCYDPHNCQTGLTEKAAKAVFDGAPSQCSNRI